MLLLGVLLVGVTGVILLDAAVPVYLLRCS
jgi:hypothetical protein